MLDILQRLHLSCSLGLKNYWVVEEELLEQRSTIAGGDAVDENQGD
jgi:hypothetical protein